MSREWNEKSIAQFHADRDERRAKEGKPPFQSLSNSEKKKDLEAEKEGMIKDEWKRRTLQAWPLDKYPLQKYAAKRKATLILPHSFQQSSGTFEKIKVKKGQDLRFLVFDYYNEQVDSKNPPGKNFVDQIGILCKRHEYLGPMPCVAGFQTAKNGDIDVQFWDSCLKVAWMRDTTWEVQVEYDAAVEANFAVI